MITALLKKGVVVSLCTGLVFCLTASSAQADKGQSSKPQKETESKEDTPKASDNAQKKSVATDEDKKLDIKDVVPISAPKDIQDYRSMSQVKTSVRSKLIAKDRNNRREDIKPGQSSGKITICHKGKAISVSRKALSAHLAHGDMIGTCEVTPKKNK